MKKILIFIILSVLTISCQAQKSDLDLKWREFEFKEAGIKVSLPCDPEKYFKSFQDEPRPIHVYSFSCEIKGMKFLISSQHYMDKFEENTFDKTFESHETNLKTIFGSIEDFNEKRDFKTSGFNSKFYEVKPESGGKINNLFVVSESRFYDAMFGILPESEKQIKESKIDYESISKKFTDSFQIIE